MVKKRIFIIFVLIIMIANIPCLARYYKNIKCSYSTSIAYPIVRVENVSNMVENLDYNKNCQELEYIFDVKNYYLENESITISEVDFDYEVEIVESNVHFPISYELFEDGNEEGVAIQNNKTGKYHISKRNQYIKRFRLVAKWNDSKELIGAEDNIDIKINVIQST